MRAEDSVCAESAYAVLGLRPGADRAQIESAYRRLMKIHHPDRSGGDGKRAAEINRAYTYLRRDYPAHLARARSVPVPDRPQRPSGRNRRGWALLLAAAIVTGLVLSGEESSDRRDSDGTVPVNWASADPREFATVRPPVAGFEEPLHARVIGNAIADAMSFHVAGDVKGAIEYSRDCHNRLRQEPNLAWFDACAAFDESALILNASNAQAETGPFGGSAVMAREMAAARALSNDIFGADSRLSRIRSQVEIALLARLDEMAESKQP